MSFSRQFFSSFQILFGTSTGGNIFENVQRVGDIAAATRTCGPIEAAITGFYKPLATSLSRILRRVRCVQLHSFGCSAGLGYEKNTKCSNWLRAPQTLDDPFSALSAPILVMQAQFESGYRDLVTRNLLRRLQNATAQIDVFPNVCVLLRVL